MLGRRALPPVAALTCLAAVTLAAAGCKVNLQAAAQGQAGPDTVTSASGGSDRLYVEPGAGFSPSTASSTAHGTAST